jgi:putative DNA methylase
LVQWLRRSTPDFLAQPQTEALRGELPELYGRLKAKGLTSFDRLFSSRQLLVAAEYIRAIRDSTDEMRRRGLAQISIEALSTYLGLFIGHLVNRNSRLCSWNPSTGDSGSTFQRLSPMLPRVFVEITPRGLLKTWLDSIEPAIREASEVAAPANLYQSSAAELRFGQDFFDAVVTDPPYYDAVPYSDLSDFFWVWERMIDGESVPIHTRTSPHALEILPATAREGALALYRNGMLSAFKEVCRVLKPGRKFCLMFSGRVTDSFQQYIDSAVKPAWNSWM